MSFFNESTTMLDFDYPTGNSTFSPGDYDEYHVYIYPGYSFERPVYMYIWGILVIITFLANILVISVLLRKKMRNPTNLILVAIAISDSLTGLVTLPSYWAVYNKHVPAETHRFNPCDFLTTAGGLDFFNENVSLPSFGIMIPNMTVTAANDARTTLAATESWTTTDVPIMLNDSNMDYPELTSFNTSGNDCKELTIVSKEGYFLDKSMCRFFMISKFFLSKTFHTISIWLTLFLGFQRYVSVAFPFRAQKLLSERTIVIVCVAIGVLAPVLHVYHLVDEKAEAGMCQWDADLGCDETCAYTIVTLILRHLLPCALLVIFTVLFIVQLRKSSSRVSRIDSNQGNSSMQHRDSENRRVSIIVTAIVVVFLIPELPYGGWTVDVVIKQVSRSNTDLETNRLIHLVYEISLVLSFHANFYIYTFFNRRFRKSLLKTVVFPVLGVFGIKPTMDLSSSVSGSRRKTAHTDTNTKIELKNIITHTGEGSHSPEHSGARNGKAHPHEEEVDEKSKFLGEKTSNDDA